jgi:hypothetical protein
MQGSKHLAFAVDPNINYKIISVLDYNLAFTLQDTTHRLILTAYHGTPNQLFKVFQNNHKYALVNPQLGSALHIEGENKNDGGVVKADAGQHDSSYFEILPVTKGEWAGKACHIVTFAGDKALDIKGGKPNPNTDICQWKFHGQGNQTWLIIPSEEPHTNVTVHTCQIGGQITTDFQPAPNSSYKIVSVQDESKCITVGPDGILHLNTFKKEPSQKFTFNQNNNRFSLNVTSTKNYLCIYQDKKDNGLKIITDPATQASSWFEVVRHDKGQWANKAYVIKTHSEGMALDVSGGKPEEGKDILQYKIHGGDNQLWLIEPNNDEGQGVPQQQPSQQQWGQPGQDPQQSHWHQGLPGQIQQWAQPGQQGQHGQQGQWSQPGQHTAQQGQQGQQWGQPGQQTA